MARTPQRRGRADAVARRSRHPVGLHARRRLLRVRTGRDHRSVDPARVAQRATVGTRRSSPDRRVGTADVAVDGLPLGAHRCSPRRPTRPRCRGKCRCRRSGPRCGQVHQPRNRRRRAVDHAHGDAPAGGRGRVGVVARPSARRSGRYSTATGGSSSTVVPSMSVPATSSRCHRGVTFVFVLGRASTSSYSRTHPSTSC